MTDYGFSLLTNDPKSTFSYPTDVEWPMNSILEEGDVKISFVDMPQDTVSYLVLTISTFVLFLQYLWSYCPWLIFCEEHYNIKVLFSRVEHKSKRRF